MIVDDTFLDRVAHDLRGELSTMLVGLHYMQRFGTDVGTSSREMLERVNEAGDRMTRLLEEMDDAVWLLDKPKALVIEKFRLQLLLDDLIRRVSHLGARRGVHLCVEAQKEGARELTGDPEVLARALLYLVDFAMLRAPGAEVRLTAEFVADRPVVCVEDHGARIPEQILARLFEPFVENELRPLLPAGRRKVRLGLGLAIARAMVAAHGGTLSIAPQGDDFTLGMVFRCVLTCGASTCGTSTDVFG